jgi:3',5'-cyclic-AMP phosphodiesterase
MQMADRWVRFAQISDTHIGPTADFSALEVVTLPCLEKMIAALNKLPFRPDFVVHSGDVVAFPNPDSYRLAALAFEKLEMPIYFTGGNHDQASDIKRFLRMGEKVDLCDDQSLLSYRVEAQELKIIVLDARGPDDIDPHGLISERQFEILEAEIRADEKPFMLVMHYPVLSFDSKWFDENMLVLNGEVLHRRLVQVRERVQGVFFGHVHKSMSMYQDGILYAAAGSSFCQFGLWPGDELPSFEPTGPASFNYVSWRQGSTVIKQISL